MTEVIIACITAAWYPSAWLIVRLAEMWRFRNSLAVRKLETDVSELSERLDGVVADAAEMLTEAPDFGPIEDRLKRLETVASMGKLGRR